MWNAEYMLMGRKGYRGKTIDELLAIGIPLQSITPRLADVLVDGKRLGEISDSLRTSAPFETRPQTKYREAFFVALAATLLELDDVSIVTRLADGTECERPDVILHFGDEVRGVEHMRVEVAPKERNFLLELEQGLNDALHLDTELQPHGQMLDFTTPSSFDIPSAKRKGLLKKELIDFFRSGKSRYLPSGQLIGTAFNSDSICAELGLAVRITASENAHGYGIRFTRDDEPNSILLLQQLAAGLNCKRHLAEGFECNYPLWLVLEITDASKLSTEAMYKFANDPTIAISPFECVVLIDGFGYAKITKEFGN